MRRPLLLLPLPRLVHQEDSRRTRIAPSGRLDIRGLSSAESRFLASRLERARASCNIVVESAAGLPPEGYRLAIDDNGVQIVAADSAGAFYGVCTLLQIVKQTDSKLPRMRIEDWPDFRVRGVLLYISGGKVPTMATFERLIDMLASW